MSISKVFFDSVNPILRDLSHIYNPDNKDYQPCIEGRFGTNLMKNVFEQ